MIPQIAKRGTSFKGAGLYYLHDKRQDGETTRSTDERVSWTATRNLMTDDPGFSLRVMAATAMDKDRLKALAGVKSTGRKSKGEVYAYSLAWHPDEDGKITQEDMLRAVDQSMERLGATEHQALIVAHNDADHPHVHVILNMVNPQTGKNLIVSNDRKKLHKWSNDYRKGRGEEHFCPNKAAKFEAIEGRKQGKKTDYIKGENISRAAYEELADLKKLAVNDNDIDGFLRKQASLDKELISRVNEVEQSQTQEKQEFTDRVIAENKALRQEYREQKTQTVQKIRDEMRPSYAELARQQENEKKYFYDREKRLSGKLKNAIDIVTRIRDLGGENDQGFLSMAFNYFARQGSRSAWLQDKHDDQLKKLDIQTNRQIKEALSELKKSFRERRLVVKKKHRIEYESLKKRHDLEREDTKNRWQLRKKEKAQSKQALKQKKQIQSDDGKHLKKADVKSAKEEYIQAKLEQRKESRQSRKGRRSRRRKRD